MTHEFRVFKKGVTDFPIWICSIPGTPFDKKSKIEFYKNLGYTVKENFNVTVKLQTKVTKTGFTQSIICPDDFKGYIKSLSKFGNVINVTFN